MRLLLLVVVLGLAGCAAKVLSANDRSVTVAASIREVGAAQQLADAECAKAGRKARLVGTPTYTAPVWIYDCVN